MNILSYLFIERQPVLFISLHDLSTPGCGILCVGELKWPRICSTCSKYFPVLSSFMTYHRVCNKINTTGTTNGAGTAYPFGAPEFTPSFKWVSCYSIFSFMYMFCRSLFVLLSFFFLPLCCLFFFGIRILITSS